MTSRKPDGILGAVLLVLAAVQYVALEAIAAAAWSHPPYNYAVDFISDLGNPVCGDHFAGRLICSPLNPVMDFAFVTQGALFIVAGFLLVNLLRLRWRGLVVALVIIHGVGVILVGFFHESTAALTNGVILVHSVGAAGTIVAGNVVAIVVGALGVDRSVFPRWYRVASVAIGVVGLAAFILLMVDRPLYNTAGGIPERVAVYTIIAWEGMTGVGLFVRNRRSAAPALGSGKGRVS